MADDPLQLDPSIAALIPLTGQSSDASTQSAPITFKDLSSLLPGSTKDQGQQTTSTQTVSTNYDAKTAASLDSLQPDFADRAKQWIDGMRQAGYNPVLHFGTRSPEEQQVLYQKYLAGGNKAVAPPMSYHTYGRAFDWVNKGDNGELQWNNDKAYQFGQELAQKYALTGIGAGDNDHIQDANYKSWKDLPRSEYGNIAKRQAPPAQPSQSPIQLASTGAQWQDLSSLLSR
jgi:LAS superfamily LD-carboxypeptidase LdcB